MRDQNLANSELGWPSRSPLKRSACDRCRLHKLRCPRSGNGPSCIRCLHACVGCVTSLPKRLGRRDRSNPAANSATYHGGGPLGSVVPSGPPPGPLSGAQGQGEFGSQSTAPAARVEPSIFLFPDAEAGRLSNPAGLGIDATTAVGTPLAAHSGSTPNSELTDHHDLQAFGAPDWQDELCSPLELPEGLEIAWGCPVSIGHNTDENSGHSREFGSQDSGAGNGQGHGSDCGGSGVTYTQSPTPACADTFFAQLNLVLFSQLALVVSSVTQTQSRRGATNLYHLGGDPPNDSNSLNPVEPNHIGDVLRNTAMFLTGIREHTKTTEPEGLLSLRSASAPQFPASSALHRLGMPTVLAILGCYFQIIAICDVIVRHLHISLVHRGPEAAEPSPVTIGLCLGGFTVQQGDLQLKILIQVLEHELETIERLLGIPVDRRVSSARLSIPRSSGGLFADASLDLCFRELMELGEGWVGEQASSATGCANVSSLRRNIWLVKQLLQTET